MSYIDDNLMTDESVVYRTQKHWAIFLFPTLIFLLLLLWVIGSVIAYPEYKGLSLQIFALELFFQLFCGTLPLLFAFINFKTSEYGITNKRVVAKVGFIRRDSLEVLLTKVEGIQVRQGILARILGYGTIEIGGTGGTKNPFRAIDAPFVFRQAAQEQIALVQD